MSEYTIRPSSLLSGGGYFTPTGAASVLEALNDNSDASYIRMATQQFGVTYLALGDAAIAADEFPDRVIAFMRVNGASGYPTGLALDRDTDTIASPPYGSAEWEQAEALLSHEQSAITTRNGPASLRKWSAAEVNTARLALHSYEPVGLATRAYYYELGALVQTQKLASAVASNLTEEDEAAPPVPVTVTADIDTWQADYLQARVMLVEMRVEKGGTGAGTGTLYAEGSAYAEFAGAGAGQTSAITVTPDTYLPNDIYSVYVRVGRRRTLHPDEWLYGDWSAAATLTVDLPTPETPNLTVTADASAGAVDITVGAGIVGEDFEDRLADVYREEDGVLVPVRGMIGLPFVGLSATGVDYEAPRGESVGYAVLVRATAVANGVEYTSRAGSKKTITLPATGWNIKCPEDATLNIIGAKVKGEPTEGLTEDVGVFRTIGRRYPVIVSGTLGGWDGSYSVRTSSAAEWAALVAILEAQKILLVESPFGESKYVRFLNVEAALSGTPSAERHSVTLPYVECERP